MTHDPKDNTLQDSFGAKTNAPMTPDYAVDVAPLVRDLRALINRSPLATRLFQMADAQGVAVRGIRGVKESVYVPENKWVFITITPHTRATAILALRYAGALREAEQNILGFTRPGPEVKDDDDWVTQNLVKNLDTIKNICIIVRELGAGSESNTEFLDSLTELGHDKIYKAFINHSDDETLIRLLAEQEQLTIKEG
jgi:hypothetical protein